MIDLHVHTNASDGQYSPEEIIEIAYNNGVDTIAITDHDSVDSLETAIRKGKEKQINVIPGIELSADYVEDMHILGYFIDYKNKKLLSKLKLLKEYRDERNNEIIEILNEMGVKLTIEEVQKIGKTDNVTKPHFAQALLRKGYTSTYLEGFSKYLCSEKVSKIKKQKLTPEEVINLITESGGVPILAHPRGLKLNYEEQEDKIKELCQYGLKGVECFYSYNTYEQTVKSLEMAKRNNLIVTGGTDFHGEIIDKNLKIGTGINNNVSVPGKVLQMLIKEKEKINEKESDVI